MMANIMTYFPLFFSHVCSEIPAGTTCKNGGCGQTYDSPASDDTECVYHPGVPIFHEGLKYWSCCTKRTTDFAAFMAQKGCAYGKHKWLPDVSIAYEFFFSFVLIDGLVKNHMDNSTNIIEYFFS